jgi:hypothetical protein
MNMRPSVILFFALVLFGNGCTLYRNTDYTLRFSDVRTGMPLERRRVEIVFAHELFPLNAPRSIHTNLDERGVVTLRLPDHNPTWLTLKGTNSGLGYFFTLDLHSLRRDARTSVTVKDRTGECQLVLTKRGESK